MVTLRETKRARTMLDAKLEALPPVADLVVPPSGWVRAIRNALGMSAAALGHRMGVSHTAVFELERSERAGTAGLDTLRKAAEALDCTLVYAFVPKRGLDATVRARAEELIDEDLRHVEQTMALEGQSTSTPSHARDELVRQLVDSRGLWSRRP